MKPTLTLPRSVLRQILRAVLPTDSDFSAFCIDFFPEVAERFSNSMDRVAKASMLLECEDAQSVVSALKQHAPQRLAQYERRRNAVAAAQKNPYRGLAAFQLDEAHLFFGREELTGQLWQRFEAFCETPGATRLLAIVGPSGSGKSSLARAGLLAALVESPVPGPHPVRLAIIKPGERPIENLARALVPRLPPDTSVLPASRLVAIEKLLKDKEISAQGLRRFAADLPEVGASSLIVFVDQFEELYTLCKHATERDLFVEILLHAASDSSRHVAIVLTLRSDFLGESQRQHPELNRLIAAQHELVPAMSSDELRAAIAKPAEQAGRPIDAATVELLLSETHGSQGTLPLLEFALTRLWEGMGRGEDLGTILRKLGGVGGALAGEAHKVYEALNEPEQVTARRALVRLVRLGQGTRDTRCRVPISELCGRGETEAVVLTVLRKFAAENARLVTLSGEGAEIWAEVTHEALFDHWTALRSWIEQSRKERALHDRAIEAAKLWFQSDCHEGRLWRSPDLDLLVDYHQRKPEELNSLQEEFLSASLQQQQRTREEAENHRQKLLDFLIDRGQQLLFQDGKSSEGLLWLHRAQGEASRNPSLLDLIRSGMQSVDATNAVLLGHRSQVNSATFSPDGRRIVTASLDHTARVWEADDGRLVAELKGHGDRVWSATFNPDGRRIVTSSADHTARVWDANDGQLVAELQGHGDDIWSAAFSSNGRRIVTASQDSPARVWDANDGRLVAELQGHGASVYSVALSPDGRRIVTTHLGHTARVWEANDGRLVAELKGHRNHVSSATFSPDGGRIVTASDDHTACLWEADDGRLVAELKGHGNSVHSATFSPDGRLIVTASADHTARVWEAECGGIVAELEGHRDDVRSATFSPDGRRIVTASADHTARVWKAECVRLVAKLEGHRNDVRSATFSPDGRRIVTASADHTARVWEADDGRLVAELNHGHDVESAAFSPDGGRIVTTHWGRPAWVWDANNGRLVAELQGHEASVYSAAFSPDGRRIVTSSADHTTRVWDANNGRLVAELQGHGASVHSAAFSPDGRRIVTASADHTARVWDANDGRLVAELQGHGASVYSAAFSLDGRRIVTTSRDSPARVWDANDGRLVAELQGHEASVHSAALSPDGRRIVTASADHTARVWDADGGRLLAELKGHRAHVRSAMFSPDGRRIATASADRTARVWDAHGGWLLAELRGHRAGVKSAIFSPDGCLVVTASDDQTACVWDLSPETRTYAQLAELIRFHVPVKFETEGSNVIVFRTPNPEECAGS